MKNKVFLILMLREKAKDTTTLTFLKEENQKASKDAKNEEQSLLIFKV